MQLTDNKIWERLPNETDKAWSAFSTFMQMPVIDPDNQENERTLLNLTRKLGYAVRGENRPATVIEKWSAKYGWTQRLRAYDNHMQSIQLTVVEASLKHYQQDLIERRTTQITALNQVIDRSIKHLLEIAEEAPVGALELVRLSTAIKNVDDISRRLAGMPTTFTTEKVVEEETEDRVFIIGG